MTDVDEAALAMFLAVAALVRYYQTLDPDSAEASSELANHVRWVVQVWERYPKQQSIIDELKS